MSVQKKTCEWCWIQQREWNYSFLSQGLFVQKLHKLKILLYILKALISLSCDKISAWMAVSATVLELSQGWSLVQEAECPQRKGIKQECGNHSFISYGDTAPLLTFKMEKTFIGTSSLKQLGELYFHTTIGKHEKQNRDASVLPWRLAEERLNYGFSLLLRFLPSQCSDGSRSVVSFLLTKLLSWGKC